MITGGKPYKGKVRVWWYIRGQEHIASGIVPVCILKEDKSSGEAQA